MKGNEFSREARRGPYVFPGGYPKYLVTTDGAALCWDCVRVEHARIRLAAMTRDKTGGWMPEGVDVNWEDPSLFCDHCGARIESAYAQDSAKTNDSTDTE